MKFVFVGYTSNKQYQDPQAWLFRIRAYIGVLEALAKQHEVISIEQIGYTGVLEQAGVKYHFIRPVNRFNYFPGALHRFIAAQSADIVLVHGMEHPLQLIQLRRVISAKPKIILQSHSSKLPGYMKKWVQRIADRSLNAYFFSSESMAIPWLQQGLISNNNKVFEVPVGSSVFQRKKRSMARDCMRMDAGTVFLWVGRLDENKDPLTVVKAFLQYAAFDASAKLYMIFQQNDLLSRLQQVLAENTLSNQVVLVGAVPHQDMADWFSSADFFISSSHFEVYGAAVVEAMSCGCIPVLSNIPAYRSITNNGACGRLFDAGDEEALYAVLLDLMKIDRVMEEAKSIAIFEQQLRFEAIAEKIANIAGSL